MIGIARVIGKIILFAFILGGGFYLGVVTGLIPLVGQVNSNFMAFMPTELKAILAIVYFGLIIGLAYTFIH